MPERFSLTEVSDVAAAFGVAADELRPRWNIAHGQQAAVVRKGARAVELLRWGILPRWSGHGGKRGPMIEDAHVAELERVPLLRDAFAKQRCLVPVDGYYEWAAGGKRFWLRAPALAALGGVWATSRDDSVPSFAILVDDAGPLAVPRAAWAAWLAGKADAARALVEVPRWERIAVSTYVTNAEHDDPKCIEPIGNARQGSLF